MGQELGSCGTNTDDDCDVVNNSTVDGAFRVTYPVRPAVALARHSGAPAWPTPTTLCLNTARFRVTVFYATSDGAERRRAWPCL